MLKQKKGFSLIEFIVVMAVMAIFVLTAFPLYRSYTKEANEKRITADLISADKKLAEYLVKNNNTLPSGNIKIESYHLKTYVNLQMVYDTKGLVSSIEPGDYDIISPSYIKREIGSKLGGTFVLSSGGNIYYFNEKPGLISATTKIPVITFVDSGNPNSMTANIIYPQHSIAQEYKIDDENWVSAVAEDVINTNLPFVLSIKAARSKIFSINVQNGSTVYARAKFHDTEVYEASLKLNKPAVNIISIDDSSVTIKTNFPNSVILTEYRTGTGEWISYENHVQIKENCIVELRGKDAEGNIIAFDTVNITGLKSIAWHGLSSKAFDGDMSTTVGGGNSNTITWTGDLTDKVVNFYISNYYASYSCYVNIKNSSGTNLPFYDINGNRHTTYTASANAKFSLIIPEGAARIYICPESIDRPAKVIEIKEAEDLKPTASVFNITATPSESTIDLAWNNPIDADFKTVWIFRNGQKIGATSTGAFSDYPLYPNTTYNYQLKAQDITGNLSTVKSISATTLSQNIYWSGLGAGAFDGDPITKVGGGNSNTITWTGNLTDKVVNFYISNYYASYSCYINIKNSSGTNLAFYDVNGNRHTTYTASADAKFSLIIPEGAARIYIFPENIDRPAKVIEIKEAEDLTPPASVFNITATPSESTIDLVWNNPIDADFKTVWIFRNGQKIGSTSTGTFSDYPLYPNTTYNYQLKAQDITGNLSTVQSISATTLSQNVYWSGLGAGAFDGDPTTTVGGGTGNTITWNGDLTDKVVNFYISNYTTSYSCYVNIKNSSGTNLAFYDVNGNRHTAYKASANAKFSIIIPEGAAKIYIYPETSNRPAKIIEIKEADDLTSTNSVSEVIATPGITYIDLTWRNPEDADFKTVWIYENGIRIGSSSTEFFRHYPLYANTPHSYTLKAQDNTGNLSALEIISSTTLARDIYWSGLGAGAFDGDPTTTVGGGNGNTITWTGDLTDKVVNFYISNYYASYSCYVNIKNSSGTNLAFYDINNKQYTTYKASANAKFSIIIPEGATKIYIYPEASNRPAKIIEIYEESLIQ